MRRGFRRGTEHRVTWLLTRLTLGPSAEPHLLATGVDVTSERQAQARLRDQAERDPLTGLANRISALRSLAGVLTDPHRAGAVVLYCDLDDFKQVNDVHGHLAGDHVLKVVAMRLSAALGPANLVARLGGDEFVALLPDVAHQEAAALVATVQAAVSAPIAWGDRIVSTTVSVGVAVARAGDDPDATLHAADVDMYRAKRGARRAVSLPASSTVASRRRGRL